MLNSSTRIINLWYLHWFQFATKSKWVNIVTISAAKEIEDIWREYEDASTSEAQFVKDLDKLEMILQAHEYETEQEMDLSDFFASTEGKFKTETGYGASYTTERVFASHFSLKFQQRGGPKTGGLFICKTMSV